MTDVGLSGVRLGCGGRIRTFDLLVLSVPGIGYVVHNKARPALDSSLA